MLRTNLIVVSILLMPFVSSQADDPPKDAALGKPPEVPAVADPEAFLQAQMKARWAKPERKTWRIEYRPIKGLADRSSWHITGTDAWVRLYPEHYKLDELDKTAVYEIDAVALNQQYNVIDFYVYHQPRQTSK